MQKVAPTTGRLLALVVFTLSCFGLLLYLWLAFGGNIPFKPKGYRFEAAFDKASQLGVQADVREAGVKIGRVVAKDVSPDGLRTMATIEIEDEYAPIGRDARVMLRSKTVGGETYIAITRGRRGTPRLPDGARLPDKQVREVQTIEDVMQLFDRPTRRAFRTWQQSFGQAVGRRGAEVNEALGLLPAVVESGGEALAVLDADRRALSSVIRDTATVFDALSSDADALQRTIVGFNTTFSATARQQRALASSVARFPGFLVETRRTLSRLERFARRADPLVRELRPGLDELPATTARARALAPDLRRLFVGLEPLMTAARTGLPATDEVMQGLQPLFGALYPFLGELNPIARWLEQNQGGFTDFISAGINALGAMSKSPNTPDSHGHYLRQLDPGGAEAVAVFTERLPTNRGNAYNNQLDNGVLWQRNNIAPVFDCRNAGGERPMGPDAPACHVQPKRMFKGKLQGQFPHVEADDYRKSPGR